MVTLMFLSKVKQKIRNTSNPATRYPTHLHAGFLETATIGHPVAALGFGRVRLTVGSDFGGNGWYDSVQVEPGSAIQLREVGPV